MSPSLKPSLIPIILSAFLSLVSAQTTDPVTGVVTIPKPNNAAGWCYYCSDNNAPALCNQDCNVAIQRLCAENLNEALTTTEKSCQLSYLPPPYPWSRNGAQSLQPTGDQCISLFSGILNNCGRDAGTPALATNNGLPGVNLTYCTTSGGGGTYGWMDDGTPINGQPRMIITTPNTDQCGQSQASWQQATSVIQWNDSKPHPPNPPTLSSTNKSPTGWIGPNDQVVLDTNPPSLTANAMLAGMSTFPTPNPNCETEVCDIYDNPYYVKSVSNPWQDGQERMLRHRVVFEGWSIEAGAVRFFNALHDRCQFWPYNWQVYKNGTQTVADFGLSSWSKSKVAPGIFDVGSETDLCWCIPYAIFDASVGLLTSVTGFCQAKTTFPGAAEFAPARKRGLEFHEGPGMLREVTGSVEEVRQKRKVREEKRAVEKRKRELEDVGMEQIADIIS